MSYYVTMKDKFMSGWGQAKGRTNIFQVECDTLKQAEQVAAAGRDREEMANVNIRAVDREPYYNKRRYLVSKRTYADLGEVWKPEWTPEMRLA